MNHVTRSDPACTAEVEKRLLREGLISIACREQVLHTERELGALMDMSDKELGRLASPTFALTDDASSEVIRGCWSTKALAEELLHLRANARRGIDAAHDSPLQRFVRVRLALRVETKEKLRRLWRKDPAKVLRLAQLEMQHRALQRGR